MREDEERLLELADEERLLELADEVPPQEQRTMGANKRKDVRFFIIIASLDLRSGNLSKRLPH